MCVPLKGRDRVLGAITFISSDPGGASATDELIFAEELARRAASGDRERAALPRGRGARAGGARARSDRRRRRAHRPRRPRPALERRGRADHRPRRRATCSGAASRDAVPGWEAIEPRSPSPTPARPARAESVPLEIGGRELWLSVSGVGYEDGTVYAFRDLTEERALESMRQDFVATVSHELRTPLAAIYGAALTLRRDDVELEAELHGEAARGDHRGVEPARRDRQRPAAREPARHRASSTRTSSAATRGRSRSSSSTRRARTCPRTSRSRSTRRRRCRRSRPTRASCARCSSNLIDNAVKYSPDGGTVERRARSRDDRHVRFSVSDSGLGIPRGRAAADLREVLPPRPAT